jgi:PAS domain S-box-containing protein
LTTGLQLFVEYKNDRDLITEEISGIRSRHLDSMALSVWHLDVEQVNLEIAGLVNLRDIEYAGIVIDNKTVWQAGEPKSENTITNNFELTYQSGNQSHKLGTLTVIGSLDNIYDRLLQKVWIILISNAAKTFVVAAFLIVLFQRLVGRHLETIAAYMGRIDINKPGAPLLLDRQSKSSQSADELDEMVEAINNTRDYLSRTLSAVAESRDQLIESEERYKTLSDISPVGVYRADASGRKTYVNDRWCEFAGLSREQALGEGWIEAVHPEDRDKAWQLWIEAREADRNFSAEYRYLKPDGETVWVYAQAAAVHADDGDVIAFVGTVTNITASVRAELAAKESQARFQAFHENLPSPINLKDEQGRFIFVNKAFAIRYPEIDDFAGLTVHDVFDAETANLIVEQDLEVSRTGRAISRQNRILRRSGEHGYVQNIKFPVDDGKQQLIGTISPDITKMVEATKMVEESEQRYRQLVDDLPVAILIQRNNAFLYANTVAARLLGYDSPEEMVGINSADVVEESHREKVRDRILQASHSDQPLPLAELTYLRKDGTPLFVQATGQMTIWAGEPAVQGVFSDITELKHVQDQLVHSQKLATVGQLTGGLAHDFNNLLQVISGATSMILVEDAGGPAGRWARQIESAVERGSSLTSQLLSFSRQQMLVPRVIELKNELSGTQSLLQRTLGEDIHIDVAFRGDMPLINIDRNALQNALLNLALNSRSAMPDGGELKIVVARETLHEGLEIDEEVVAPGDYVSIGMSDSGCGMSPTVMERAFDPFYTTKEVGEGSGLGLSMVYGFARQSGGFASIESVVDQGTTITLTLPVASGGLGKIETPENSDAAPAPGRGTILVVEDDIAVRTTTSDMMRGLGYQVVEAEDGRSALDILRTNNDIDGVFSDVVMPGGMSGLELARQISEMDHGPAVQLTSGYPENYVEERDRDGEQFLILQKPYSMAQLRQSMQRLLSS